MVKESFLNLILKVLNKRILFLFHLKLSEYGHFHGMVLQSSYFSVVTEILCI